MPANQNQIHPHRLSPPLSPQKKWFLWIFALGSGLLLLVLGLIFILSKQLETSPEILFQSGFGQLLESSSTQTPAQLTTNISETTTPKPSPIIQVASSPSFGDKLLAFKNKLLNSINSYWQTTKKWLVNLFSKKQQNLASSEPGESAIFSQDLYVLAARNQKLKKLIADSSKTEDIQIDNQVLAEILNFQPNLNSKVSQEGNQFRITTNAAGQIKQSLPKGIYQLKVVTLDTYDFTNLPEKIVLEDRAISILLGMKVGEGKVSSRSDFSSDPALILPKNPPSENEQYLLLNLFHDQNSNGQLDSEEKLVPWAGVTIILEKQEEAGFGKILR